MNTNMIPKNLESEYIYHLGDRVKDLALHKRRDYETGLSFLDYEPAVEHIRFRVKALKNADFDVIFDSKSPMVKLPFFGREPYIEPNSGLQWDFPIGHATVYHKNFVYWTRWHQADVANFASTEISHEIEMFYNLSKL